jgi:ABC-type dipeptide/oligopeptide/nickel transport system permease component
MRWLLGRALWLVAMLLGVTFVTFVVLDAAPIDRAELAIARAAPDRAFADVRSRDLAVLRLRVRYGMLDPVTLEPRPLLERYGAWLGNAVRLRFGGPLDDHAALLARIGAALPVTAWLGALALAIAFGLGVPLGVRLGARAGSRVDRAVSTVLLVAGAVPEFLAAVLLTLAFSSVWLQWLPANGLASPGAAELGLAAQLLDFAAHLVLPVTVLAIAPTVLVVRFVRDAVARAARAPFAAALRALGSEPAVVRARLRRHGCVPVATLAGALLPMLVGGSIVVENVFALDGLGHLAFTACKELDQPMVMALVVLGTVATLFALALSDALHRALDPRVRLA